MIYELIIIGAGASGLFAGSSLPRPVNGLIIEKRDKPGRKLLMSGSGQCNLTHGGSIKDFISHYGDKGPGIRSVLYKFNNLAVMNFFESKGVPLIEREDGKVFPRSLKGQDILDVLMKDCHRNGLQFLYSSPVNQISVKDFEDTDATQNPAGSEMLYTVHCGSRSYQSRKLIIAAGGCSYPSTGSDGSIFLILESMGIEVNPLSPALTPLYVEDYPYRDLSGISFPDAAIVINSPQGPFSAENGKTVAKAKSPVNRDALLLTHNCFSGPGILNLSRNTNIGDTLVLNYYPKKSGEIIIRELSREIIGNNRQILSVLYDYFVLPKRFLEVLCKRAGIDATEKASRISALQLKSLISLIVRDEFIIQKLGGYESAMVTSGGVPVSEIDPQTMESRKYPCLYFAGEVLDVDGDTGGYNLQFAFSSANLAAMQTIK